MNQKQLTYFMEAYRCRNIQAAADNLYISHQGLSRVILSLEEELGEPLFVRLNRGLQPTDFANTLVPHVQKLLDDYQTLAGIRSLNSSNKSVVTVAALDHVFGYLGVDFITGFAEANPMTTLNILDTTDEHALDTLASGNCDFAIVNGPIDHERFTAEPLFYSRYCFRINKNNPLAQKPVLCIDDFVGQNIIGKGRSYRCFRNNINRYLFEAGKNATVPVETSDEVLLRELVEQNFAIAATYDFSAVDYCGENTVIRYMEDESMGQQIYLVEDSSRTATKAANAFKKFLLEHKPEAPKI